MGPKRSNSSRGRKENNQVAIVPPRQRGMSGSIEGSEERGRGNLDDDKTKLSSQGWGLRSKEKARLAIKTKKESNGDGAVPNGYHNGDDVDSEEIDNGASVSYDEYPSSRKCIVLAATTLYAILSVFLLSWVMLPPLLDHELDVVQGARGSRKVEVPVADVYEAIDKAAKEGTTEIESVWDAFAASNKELFLQLQAEGTPVARAAFSRISQQRGILEVQHFGHLKATLLRVVRGLSHLAKMESWAMEHVGPHAVGCLSLQTEMPCPNSASYVPTMRFTSDVKESTTTTATAPSQQAKQTEKKEAPSKPTREPFKEEKVSREERAK